MSNNDESSVSGDRSVTPLTSRLTDLQPYKCVPLSAFQHAENRHFARRRWMCRCRSQNNDRSVRSSENQFSRFLPSTLHRSDRSSRSFSVRKDEFSYRKCFQFMRDTYRTEGFLRLYRGNSANLARVIPSAAIYFTAHEQWKRLLSPINISRRSIRSG